MTDKLTHVGRVKSNIKKMLDQGAPEADVDQYLAEEGVTPQDLKWHKLHIQGQEQLAAETEPVEAAMVAAGRTVDKLKAGVQDLYHAATGGDAARQELAEEQARSDQQFAPLSDRHTSATMAGGILPYLAAPYGVAANAVGKGISAVPGLSKVGGAVAKSGLADATLIGTGLGVADYDTTAGEGALYSAGGYGFGKAATRLASPLTKKVGDASHDLIAKAKELGMKASPGSITQSRPVQMLESSLKSFPFTSGPFARMAGQNQEAINRAAGKAIGVDDTKALTREVMGDAEERIGTKFDELLSGKEISIADDFLNKHIDELGELERVAKIADDSSVSNLFNSILESLQSGKMSGAEYQRLTKMLNGVSRRAFGGGEKNYELGRAAALLKDSLDDQAEAVLGKEGRSALREARNQWRNLILLRSRVSNINEAGDVSAANVRNTLTGKDSLFRKGKRNDDLATAAAFGSKHRDVVGDSGTATRLSLPLLAMGAAGGEHFDQEWLKNLALLGIAGNLGARGYLSKYVTNPRMTEATRGLLGNVGSRASYGLLSN